MSMQVRPGYVNPLTAMREHEAGVGVRQKTGGMQKGMKDKVKELQLKQQLQSEMLLMRATGSDTDGNSVKKLEKMETKLSEVTEDLKTARKDSYVRGKDSEESAGIYEVRDQGGQRVVRISR